MSRLAKLVSIVGISALSLALSGCSFFISDAQSRPDGNQNADAVSVLRLGYFANLTHAPALVAVERGLFETKLKPLGIALEPTVFNAGPDAVTALLAGSLDIAYLGPNPTINAYTVSNGSAVRVIAGSTSGGAALVVSKDITQISQLAGKTLATPQLGNTQDVALRYFLKTHGLSTDKTGSGDVSILPQSNAEGLSAFLLGHTAGAWVPEPWVSAYVKAGAQVLVNESDLWPNHEFINTNVVVRSEFLQKYPAVVAAFLAAHLDSLDFIATQPAQAQKIVADKIGEVTGSKQDSSVIASAWKNVAFGFDPLAKTLAVSADHAVAVGLLAPQLVKDVGGFGDLYNLDLLNAELRSRNLKPVD